MAAALRVALSEQRRCRAQRTQLDRLEEEAPPEAPVVTLPFLFDTDLGLDEWEQLSVELEERL